MKSLFDDICHIVKNPVLPPPDDFSAILDSVFTVLNTENPLYRPIYKLERTTGGMLLFSDEIPALIIPDLHARLSFFYSVLVHTFDDGECVYDKLSRGALRVICLGDGLHSEERGKERWAAALESYSAGSVINEHICAEMAEGLSLMTVVMKLKTAFPMFFHFLKGNHENILNEDSSGNYPFSKYAYEGLLSYEFFTEYYGSSITAQYANFEKKLPLFVVGKRFLASHAEPVKPFSKREITAGQSNAEVTRGLTWTANGEALAGSVKKMLRKFLPKYPDAVYFGGHRVVKGLYDVREDGRFFQIHSRHNNTAAYVPADRTFNPEYDIINIQNGAEMK